MSKHLIIEIGTNSIKSLSAAYINDKWSNFSDSIHPSRIGENMTKTGVISREAMDRNLKVISRILEANPVTEKDHIHIIATESLRQADNTQEFTDSISQLFGLDLEILSGYAEAELAYWGATSHNLTDAESDVAVVDIGGGSTELTIGRGNKILSTQSLPLGAVKLTEFCIKHDPVTAEELNIAKSIIQDNINKLRIDYPVIRLIGVGGTVTTLSALDCDKLDDDYSPIDNRKLSIHKIYVKIGTFTREPIAVKEKMQNMPAGRANIILAGSMILEGLMLKLGLDEVTTSIRGVRHGYLHSRIIP